MSDKTPIENLFHKAFENFEADVNPELWVNIEQQIPGSAPSPSAEHAVQSGKQWFFGSNISPAVLSIASVALVSVLAITYYAVKPGSKPELNQVPASSIQIETSPVIPDNKETNKAADVKHENSQTLQVEQPSSKPVADKTLPVTGIGSESKGDEGDGNNRSNSNISSPTSDNDVIAQETAKKNEEEKTQPSQATSNQAAADEKHEKQAVPVNENEQILPLEKPVQNDDFDWGIIANSFSPNKDGINDEFTIKTEGLKSIDVTIIDRTGKTLCKWNAPDGSWDGKDLNGKEMPAGFYLYYIFAESADGKAHNKKGTLYLFR